MLFVLAAALVAAFVLLPPALTMSGAGVRFAGELELGEAFRAAFVEYWASGRSEFTPALADVVTYWFRYHVLKSVLALLLLGVLSGLAFTSRRGSPRTVAVLGVAVLATLATVLANLQGAAAPFASLLPMLTAEPHAPALADLLAEADRQLANPPTEGRSAAVDLMVSDFAAFHAVMAALAAVSALGLLGFGVITLRRSRRREVASRRASTVLVVAAGIAATALVIVAAVNTSTALNPVPPLRDLLAGGW